MSSHFLASLLPLRIAVITLRFNAAAHLPIYHQPIVTAFVRSLIEDENAYAEFLWIDAPESGGQFYQAGDDYCFALYCLPGGEAMFDRLLRLLQNLPESAPRRGEKLALRDNLSFVDAVDLFGRQAIEAAADLTGYGAAEWAAECAIWQYAPILQARFLTPLRILRDKAARGAAKGEARFCREIEEVSYSLLHDRLLDACGGLARRRGIEPPPREVVATRALDGDLFWIDAGYRDADGNYRSMGGVQGMVAFAAPLPEAELALWVLGQYIGFGQRRAFGWGRYRLENYHCEYTLHRAQRAAPLLGQVAQADNLREAYQVVESNQWQRTKPAEAAVWEAPEEDNSDLDAARLARLGEKLVAHTYQPALLRGVLLAKPDGGIRPLAVPPFWDRVAQRACAQFLNAGLEALFYRGSFGYRLGRSRHLAKTQVEHWYADGYRWVYESDIEAFFDSVNWEHLHQRLEALLGNDPLVDLLMAWMAAPVEYEGEVIERQAGLPQGSPLSPLLANVMLDDFDRDLEAAGFKLARFADDFVVLCKSREEAEVAARVAQDSLAEWGLSLNAAKTDIRHFSQGFRWLGFLFVNGLTLDTSGEPRPAQAPKPLTGWAAGLDLSSSRTGSPSRTASPQDLPGLKLPETAEENTVLMVSGEPARVSSRDERVVVTRDDTVVAEQPWRATAALILVGGAQHITTPALRDALKYQVPVHFVSGGGQYQGVAWNGKPGEAGWELWLLQAQRVGDAAAALQVAQSLVLARIHHQHEVLRKRNVTGQFDAALTGLKRLSQDSQQATNLESLNGFEGSAARVYFQALQALVPDELGFDGRKRRPPPDPFNALLSLGYTILYSHTESALRVAGLFPWLGFYHASRGRHAALASDLMEPFRHIVERAALDAVRRHGLTTADFFLDATGACKMHNTARRRYLALLTEAFQMPQGSRYNPQALVLSGHLAAQNRALIAWLRGRTEAFQAWRMRG